MGEEQRVARCIWGTVFGGLGGFVFGKVYLIWAMLFDQYGGRLDEAFRTISYETSSPPLFVWAPAHNTGFMAMITLTFAGIGLLYALTTQPGRAKAVSEATASDAAAQCSEGQ